MTSPANSTTTDDGRFYTLPTTGEQFVSVTTVMKNGVPKPVLVPWAQKKCAEFAVNHIQLLDALRRRSNGV